MKNTLKIYLIGALILSASLFIFAFLNPNAAIDIQQQDAYFVILVASFYNGMGFLLLLKLVLVFLLIDKTKPNRLLSNNLLIDIGLIVLGLCVRYYYSYSAVPKRYYRFDNYQQFSNVSNALLTQLFIIFALLYLLNQLFFVGVIIFNYSKRKKEKK